MGKVKAYQKSTCQYARKSRNSTISKLILKTLDFSRFYSPKILFWGYSIGMISKSSHGVFVKLKNKFATDVYNGILNP
jgi:hypothetical protein